MTATTPVRDRTFAEAKRLCYAGLDAPAMLHAVVGSLRRAVPFESYCATTNDPRSGLLTSLIGDAFGDAAQRTYLEHVYFEEDLDAQRNLAQSRVPVVVLSEATGGHLDRAMRYRVITGPMGLGHEVMGVFAVAQRQWGGLCLMRERGGPDFDPRETALIQQLAPHVSAGLQAAALRRTAEPEREADDGPGVLSLDGQGRVIRHTAAAERWLRDLGDLGPGWREGDGLPAAARTIVGALRAALQPVPERDVQAGARVQVRTRSGRWLTLHGARTLSGEGDGGETMIIIEPSRPHDLAWLQAAAYGLSQREREVVDWVVMGASTREIALGLAISENTVQEHLSHAFDKVGVRGRRALVRRLFMDNIYPGLHQPVAEDAD